MKQEEDKELLLKDLCARLPYGVKIHKALYEATTLNERDIESFRKGFDDTLIPYLRPMSSMTDEEKCEFRRISNCKVYKDDFYNEDCEYSEGFTYIDKNTEIETFNWLNAHHFDYRGLIKRGIALEAPKGMYNN